MYERCHDTHQADRRHEGASLDMLPFAFSFVLKTVLQALRLRWRYLCSIHSYYIFKGVLGGGFFFLL